MVLPFNVQQYKSTQSLSKPSIWPELAACNSTAYWSKAKLIRASLYLNGHSLQESLIRITSEKPVWRCTDPIKLAFGMGSKP
ncbi:hypothetical protein HanRHA438_Chr12g0556281 [Helianthus annuus]|nr:hypothetical protein HanRHA438_Chr12g0556281 [Helianthus annuus]